MAGITLTSRRLRDGRDYVLCGRLGRPRKRTKFRYYYRKAVLAKGSVITLANLYLEEQPEKAPFNTNEYFVLPAKSTLAQIEREAIDQALHHTDGNREATARLLNIGVATLYRRFKKHQIR